MALSKFFGVEPYLQYMKSGSTFIEKYNENTAGWNRKNGCFTQA